MELTPTLKLQSWCLIISNYFDIEFLKVYIDDILWSSYTSPPLNVEFASLLWQADTQQVFTKESPPLLFVRIVTSFRFQIYSKKLLFLFNSRKTLKTVSNKEEKAPCSTTAALNIFALKIDFILTCRNAVRIYLFRSRECEIHRGGSTCKNKEKTALKSVQV